MDKVRAESRVRDALDDQTLDVAGDGTGPKFRMGNASRAATTAVAFLLIAIIAGAGGLSSAAAQEPTVIVARTVVAEANLETPFPIQIRNRDELPKNSFIRIEGDLSGFKLSQGHRVSRKAWAVPIGKLGQLTVTRTTASTAQRTVKVRLVALAGGSFRSYAEADVSVLPKAALAAKSAGRATRERALSVMRATSRLPVGENQAAGQRSGTAGVTPPPNPKPALSPAKRRSAEAMMKRGNALLGNGDVDSARLFYQRAARIGLGEGAMALAATYDPDELRSLGVIGIEPNLDEAKRWYQKAMELGVAGARTRLARLEARR